MARVQSFVVLGLIALIMTACGSSSGKSPENAKKTAPTSITAEASQTEAQELASEPVPSSAQSTRASNFLTENDLPLHPNETPELRLLINRYAALYGVPSSLVHRVVIRESTHRPGARNGPYYGLMQILPETARTMGHRGPPSELLNAETNLKYAVKYLRGAWLLSYGSHDTAVKWYSQGYYYEAKRRGMLEETGLR